MQQLNFVLVVVGSFNLRRVVAANKWYKPNMTLCTCWGFIKMGSETLFGPETIEASLIQTCKDTESGI